ncbi:MAG: NUDIX domain-containing protein [Candidatus Marinimicrobia bacterium]|nr:NUDIX domain-containing protein [Candidatus Neomarinimicrobiota bacterium]
MNEIIGHAPEEVWQEILKWVPIPTVDLVLEWGNEGVIVVRRKIEPYKGKWALPGLRMLKGENFDDTIKRIAEKELGLQVNPNKKRLLGVYVGKFITAQQRQDVSTGFYIPVSIDQMIAYNQNHFSGVKITKSIPQNMGAMYQYYLRCYQKLKT